MRRVVSPQEVAHLWAHAHQDTARNSGDTLYFVGDTIYSYGSHFPIARRLGYRKYAFTTDSYSTTTSKHKSVVRGAIPRGANVVYVSNPTMRCDVSDAQRVTNEVESLLDKASNPRLRKATVDGLVANAISKAEDFNTLAEWVESPHRIDVEAITSIPLAERRKLVIAAEAAAEAAAKERERLAGLALADQLAAWKRGDPDISTWQLRNAPVALRLAESRGTYRTGGLLPDMGSVGLQCIETSHSAQIPVDDAKRLWPIIQRTMRGEKDYEVGMVLGSYRLTKIRRDGSIVVGCHDIAYSEIEDMAKKLGLIEEKEPA